MTFNAGITQRGFRLRWEAIDPPEAVPNNTEVIPPGPGESAYRDCESKRRNQNLLLLLGVNPSCSFEVPVKNELQTLSSPGYPDGYENNLVCQWILKAPIGYSIWINWTVIDMENIQDCRYDSITIEGSNLGSIVDVGLEMDSLFTGTPKKLCYLPTKPAMIFRDPEISLKFSTDRSVNRTGFSMQYKLECGGDIILNSGGGNISSPGFLQNQPYPVSTLCVWRIQFNSGRAVSISFPSFELEDSVDCHNDYVKLKNGFQSYAPQLGEEEQYCGTRPPSTLKTSTNGLFVVFRSDSQRTAKGFVMQFE